MSELNETLTARQLIASLLETETDLDREVDVEVLDGLKGVLTIRGLILLLLENAPDLDEYLAVAFTLEKKGEGEAEC